jgi:hypothetical protein
MSEKGDGGSVLKRGADDDEDLSYTISTDGTSIQVKRRFVVTKLSDVEVPEAQNIAIEKRRSIYYIEDPTAQNDSETLQKIDRGSTKTLKVLLSNPKGVKNPATQSLPTMPRTESSLQPKVYRFGIVCHNPKKYVCACMSILRHVRPQLACTQDGEHTAGGSQPSA